MSLTLTKARATLLIFSVGALIVSGGLYAYMYRTTAALTEKVLVARDTILAEERSQTAGKDIIAVSVATAESRAQLSSFFVPADDAVAFIQAVEDIGSVTGADPVISSITADNLDKAAPGTVGKITAHVNMSGSWQAVMRTLELIEALPYRNTVDRVTVSTSVIPGSGQTTRGWQIGFDVTASTLVRPPVRIHATSTPS